MKKAFSILLALATLLACATNLINAKENDHGHGKVLVDSLITLREPIDIEVPSDDGRNKIAKKYIHNHDNVKVGFWLYGRRDGQLVSDYKCYVGEGHASVISGDGHIDDGEWVKPDHWSKASVHWYKGGGNEAYYDYR